MATAIELDLDRLSRAFELYGFTLRKKKKDTHILLRTKHFSESDAYLWILEGKKDERVVPYYRRCRGKLQIATTVEILTEFMNRASVTAGEDPETGERVNLARIVPEEQVYVEEGMNMPEIPKTSFYVALLGATIGEYIMLPTGNPLLYTNVYHLVTET